MQVWGELNASYDEMGKRGVMVELTVRNHGLEGLPFIRWLSLDQSPHKMFGKVLLLTR